MLDLQETKFYFELVDALKLNDTPPLSLNLDEIDEVNNQINKLKLKRGFKEDGGDAPCAKKHKEINLVKIYIISLHL